MKTSLLAIVLSLSAFAQVAKPAPADRRCAIPDQPVAITHCEASSIYVADFDRAAIEQILSRYFDGFTILPARGCWHKLCENSVVIQIAGAAEADLRKAAEELRVAGKQEQVIVMLPRRAAPEVPRR